MKKGEKNISLPDVRVSQLPPALPPPERPVLSGFSDPPPGGVSRTSFVNAPLGRLPVGCSSEGADSPTLTLNKMINDNSLPN